MLVDWIVGVVYIVRAPEMEAEDWAVKVPEMVAAPTIDRASVSAMILPLLNVWKVRSDEPKDSPARRYRGATEVM